MTSDHDGLGGAVMDDVSSGPVIIDCQSEMELRLVWPHSRHLVTPQPHVGSQCPKVYTE